MSKLLLWVIFFAILVILIMNDTWRLTLNTADYTISISFVMAMFFWGCLLWFFSLFKKPFQWWQRFQNFKTRKHHEKVSEYLSEVLTAFLSHHTENNSKLIHKAEQLYGLDSKEVLLVSALLQPQTNIFQSLNASETETTKLAGIYGLVQEAEAAGNFEQINELLQQIPPALTNTPWVSQVKMRLALHQSDWSEALRLLESSKRYLSKKKYLSQKACLLLKLGKIKEAYKTDSHHPAIALAYAQFNPKKALKILKKAWAITPGWPLYLAIKKNIQNLPEAKQIKILLDITRSKRDERVSLLARADMDMTFQNWTRAKENLENYLRGYPLTRQVADMMAAIERKGWHHEQIAQEWERKSVEAEDDTLWMCSECNHAVNEWQVLCPYCNAFDSLYLK